MAIGAGAPTNEHGYTLNEDYSPVISEARAVFEQFCLRDIQTALQVLAVHELQKLNERLDSLMAAESTPVQSETEPPRRGRPRKAE